MNEISIVGAGIGGLYAGIRLLKEGYKVSVYEKENHVGGLCHIARSEDGQFVYDYASSVLLNSEAYMEILEYTGFNHADYYEMIRLNEYFRVFYADGISFDMSCRMDELLVNIEKAFKNEGRGFIKYIQKSYAKNQLSEKHFLNQSFIKAKEALKPQKIFNTLRVNSSLTAYSYFKGLLNDERLIDLLLFLTLFVGYSPFKMPAVYGLIPAIIQMKGLVCFKGGAGVYPKVLKRIFLDLGGRLFLNSPVERILAENGAVKGLLVNGQSFLSDRVIVNSDYCYTISELLKEGCKAYPGGIKSIKKSCSVFLLRFGLDKLYPGLSVHNLLINRKFREEIEGIFKGILPESPSLYIYYPASYDDSFIKNGNTFMNILVRVPNLSSGCLWDKTIIQEMKDRMKAALLKIPVLDDINRHIIYEEALTPLDFKNKYNYCDGQGFGIAHTYGQSMVFRPQVKSPDFKNLYFVGSSVHPGTGATFVMKCAKTLADLIVKEDYDA